MTLLHSLDFKTKSWSDNVFFKFKEVPVEPVHALGIFFKRLGIFLFLFDIGCDLNVAVQYYNLGRRIECLLTIMLMILPAFVITAISLHM